MPEMEFNLRQAPDDIRNDPNERRYIDEAYERGDYTWGYPELVLQYMVRNGRLTDWYYMSEKSAHNLFLALGKHFAGKSHRDAQAQQ